MDAVVMCGGRGSRLAADVEKPLYEVGGRPMVDRVFDALAASDVETAYAVTSPETPQTRDHVDVPVVDAPGEGYVADLQYALDRVGTPAMTVAADLPLLAPAVVDRILDEYDGGSLTVCVPAALKRLLGVGVDTATVVDGRRLSPTGANVVAEDDAGSTVVRYDARLAVNVNRIHDARVAERLL